MKFFLISLSLAFSIFDALFIQGIIGGKLFKLKRSNKDVFS